MNELFALNAKTQWVPGAATQTWTAILPAVTLAPVSVEGGNHDAGTVTICTAAPAGGIVVALQSGTAAVASLPATVTIPAGAFSVGFDIATVPVSLDTPVSITAVADSQSATGTLIVTPPVPTGVVLAPNSVQGGLPTTGTVTISRAAPAAGVVVSLASDKPAAAWVPFPSTVTVPAGATTANFTVQTAAVVTDTTANILATVDATSATGALTVKH